MIGLSQHHSLLYQFGRLIAEMLNVFVGETVPSAMTTRPSAEP
jgi:hypothetical protein